MNQYVLNTAFAMLATISASSQAACIREITESDRLLEHIQKKLDCLANENDSLKAELDKVKKENFAVTAKLKAEKHHPYLAMGLAHTTLNTNSACVSYLSALVARSEFKNIRAYDYAVSGDREGMQSLLVCLGNGGIAVAVAGPNNDDTIDEKDAITETVSRQRGIK